MREGVGVVRNGWGGVSSEGGGTYSRVVRWGKGLVGCALLAIRGARRWRGLVVVRVRSRSRSLSSASRIVHVRCRSRSLSFVLVIAHARCRPRPLSFALVVVRVRYRSRSLPSAFVVVRRSFFHGVVTWGVPAANRKWGVYGDGVASVEWVGIKDVRVLTVCMYQM